MKQSATVYYCIAETNTFVLFCSRSTGVSECTLEEEKQRQDEGSLRALSPLVHGPISSDESEAEGLEEPLEFPSSATHPRPLAVSLYFGVTGKKNTREFLPGLFVHMKRQYVCVLENNWFPQTEDVCKANTCGVCRFFSPNLPKFLSPVDSIFVVKSLWLLSVLLHTEDIVSCDEITDNFSL